MPFATHLRRATTRDERGPFRAPSPPLSRWSIAPAFDEPRPAPAMRRELPSYTHLSRLVFGDPGYARDTSARSSLSRRGLAWCPITSLSSTHVRVSTSRHLHDPRSTRITPWRRHANRSPFWGNRERLGAFARRRRCRSNPPRVELTKGTGRFEAPASFPSASRDGEASKRRTMHAASLVTVSGLRRMRRQSTKRQA